MALQVRNEGANVQSTINVTPMVDVMLVLLIIFMVVTPMLQHGHPVEMAKVDHPVNMPDADKEDALLVAIQRDGKVYLGNDPVEPSALTQKVKDKLAAKAQVVFVRADKRAKFGVVADTVDNIRAAGVDQIGLLTERKQAPNAPPAQ